MSYAETYMDGFTPQEVAAKDAKHAMTALEWVNTYNEAGDTAKAADAMDCYLFFIDLSNTEPAL